ncbi:hypothetical protein [Rubrivivax gelatinosus]|uniref:hypothetical protein n=1 Tax=Rubrivivax gelatinosus TaxID=28068 RepID=UPI001A27882E|nr:hypothetical protein [Rubrivivax gelatinosus]MBG6079248.1 hypothetical protein [Rubrivivax gelatinosus]
MTVILNPAEIYLLSRYASLDYFGAMRDHFGACVRAAESGLERFMLNLPRRYRDLEAWRQPDIVWGGRVIPNMKWALDVLNRGYIDISHGDLDGMGASSNVGSAFSSIVRDYSVDWMSGEFRAKYSRERADAWMMAMNIYHTYYCNWEPRSLTTDYDEGARGLMSPPESWPLYLPSRTVKVESGQQVLISGVYLPAAAGCSQFLIRGHVARGALPPDDPNDLRTTDERAIPTTWTLVEKIADSGGGIPGASDPWLAGIRERCIAGEACPRTGWWTTPAAPARRRFVAGTVMPELGGDWGTTVWQLEQPD